MRREVSPDLFRGVAQKIDEAITEGIADDTPDDDFVEALRHSGEVFSAFKVHRAQNDMAAKLLDSNGALKPFDRWLNDVLPIASHQCGSWLRTEYDTAVIRAQQAAEWKRFERDKDVLPNLKWVPSTSPNPGADHRIYWGTVLPVDHPFWSRHRPGDRWNCQCSLESTDEPVTGIKAEDSVDPRKNGPQKGLQDNPGKTGNLFGQDHPYYPESCPSCPFVGGLTNRLGMIFRGQKRDCNNCRAISQQINKAASLPEEEQGYTIIPTTKGRVRIHCDHGADEAEENIGIASYFANKYGEEIDLIPNKQDEKSADVYNSTRGYEQEYKRNLTSTKNAIDTELRKAAKQASHIVLEIQSDIDFELLGRGIRGRVFQANIEEVIVICNKKDAVYSRAEILSKGFTMHEEDFK